MTDQEDLIERVREALSDRSPREVSMFGGVSFMIEGRMVVAARREGELLLRIDPTAAKDLLARPGAHPALMGADRPMACRTHGRVGTTARPYSTTQDRR